MNEYVCVCVVFPLGLGLKKKYLGVDSRGQLIVKGLELKKKGTPPIHKRCTTINIRLVRPIKSLASKLNGQVASFTTRMVGLSE